MVIKQATQTIGTLIINPGIGLHLTKRKRLGTCSMRARALM